MPSKPGATQRGLEALKIDGVYERGLPATTEELWRAEQERDRLAKPKPKHRKREA
ncbi:hypothetical protein FRC07_015142, partial [Ceratobasidium sp. 392]